MSDIRSFPTAGTPEWYRHIEQMVIHEVNERNRLWTELTQQSQQVGDAPIDPDFTLPS